MKNTMNPNDRRDVRRLFDQSTKWIFEFTRILENQSWILTCDIEVIKMLFKHAKSVEDITNHYRDSDVFDLFLSELERISEVKVTDKFDEDTFLKAGDALLRLFISAPGLTHLLDVALRMFTSLFSSDRLEEILTQHIVEASSVDAMLEFFKCNAHRINSMDSSRYVGELVLQALSDSYTYNEQIVTEQVLGLVSNYKIEMGSLPILLGIVGMKIDANPAKTVRQLIIDALLAKMSDRSIVARPFWLSLFRGVDRRVLLLACENCEPFLDAVCRFIIYIGCMMEETSLNSVVKWYSNPQICICPEITHNDLVNITKLIHDNPVTRACLRAKVIEARQLTVHSVWKSLEEDWTRC